MVIDDLMSVGIDEFLLKHFNLKKYEMAIKQGEVPQQHTGLIPSLVKDVRYFITAGSSGRAFSILKGYEKDIVDVLPPKYWNTRGLIFGTYKETVAEQEFKVGVISSGMGPSSVEIVLGLDLFSVIEGDITIIRAGTAGTISRDLKAGDLSIGNCAVSDEGVTRKYVEPDYMATASPDVVASLSLASQAYQNDVSIGPKITKDSLLSEIGLMPKADIAQRVFYEARRKGVLSSSMESSVIYALCDLYSRGLFPPDKASYGNGRAGTVVAIVNNPPESGTEALFTEDAAAIAEGERKVVEIAQNAVKLLYLKDNSLLPAGLLQNFTRKVSEIKNLNAKQVPNMVVLQEWIKEQYR